jgi:hypothetical protein
MEVLEGVDPRRQRCEMSTSVHTFPTTLVGLWLVVLSFGLGMSVPMRFCLVVGSCVVLTFLVLLDVCC